MKAHTEHRACRDGITVLTERNKGAVTPMNNDNPPLSSARISPQSRDDSPIPSDISASNFMVYIPERKGTSILFTLNQLLCDPSQGSQGLGPNTDGNRVRIPGESNKM